MTRSRIRSGPEVAAPSTPVLEGDRLRRTAAGGTVLLDDASIQVSAGESVAVVGPPGAGKTLLLRALVLLDPLEGGEVRFRGEPVPADGVPAFRRAVLYVQQRPTLIEGTVRENLALPFSFHSAGTKRFDEERAVQGLNAVDRDRRFLDRPVADLSGGESQIVALLRALQLDPAVLLLDEPTASLDGATQAQVERLLSAWMRSAGDDAPAAAPASMVIITHDESQAERMCDRQVRLVRGRMADPAEPPGK